MINGTLLFPNSTQSQSFKRSIYITGFYPVENSSKDQNFLSKSAYTFKNFIPLSLFLSFYNIPILWYLLISIIEIFMPNTNQLLTVVPFSLLITISVISQGYSFYKDRSLETIENSAEYLV